MRAYSRWTPDEDAILVANWGKPIYVLEELLPERDNRSIWGRERILMRSQGLPAPVRAVSIRPNKPRNVAEHLRATL